MDYAAVKVVHQATVVLSFCGFFARGLGALQGATWVRSRAARTLPHVIDTALLASAIMLAWLLRVSPIEAPWLLAKVIGLLLYIGLGMVALRPGRPVPVRLTAYLAALATFAYVVSVAISKSPAGYFDWIGRS